MAKQAIKILSRGIKSLTNLGLFIPEYDIVNKNYEAILGWGFKSTAKPARDLAKKENLPYLALEDGFIRSVGLGVEGANPLSLVFDDLGIYYDARQASRLESLIIDSDNLAFDEINRSQYCMTAIKQFQLSKYNQIQIDKGLQSSKPQILVIDQTRGDASVEGALANEQTFVDMLKSAIDAHPNETIWVKVHPDVITGKKKGFLYPLPIEHPNIKLYSNKVNPWDFLSSTQHVYTVSSLMGFEALIAGCEVHCFGIPFYSGWGLTHDAQECVRRNKNRTLEQVFHAAYIQYARYIDPILKKSCGIERVLSYIIDDLRRMETPPQHVNINQISKFKKTWINDYLKSWNFIKASSNSQSLNINWGIDKTNKSSLIIEDGFIRSVGLGVHFNKPISLVCDRRGIYFDATRESDLEYLLNNAHRPSLWDSYRAKTLIKNITSLNLTKYNVGVEKEIPIPKNKKVILVPGQVEGDASIKYGSSIVKSNAHLLTLVRNKYPEAYIIYKPHPDVVSGQRDQGNWEGSFIELADQIETDVSITVLLNLVDEVHTMTSLTGFEALLRGKKVFTYGMPFYAGWGLTTDYLSCKRRTRTLSLESLVLNTLAYYPTYIDPITHQSCSVEQAIDILSNLKRSNKQVKDIRIALFMFMKKIKNMVC